MKVCKIILIALLIIKTLKEIITTLSNLDSEHPLEEIISSVIVIGIAWGLYYGAGILDI